MKRNFTDFGLEVSNACNANCSFCAYRFMERKLKQDPHFVHEILRERI